MAETVYILLGSNLGDREKNLDVARDRLSSIEGIEVIAVSSVYLSEAQQMKGENPTFLNQVVKADYSFSPYELLRTLETIEQDMGRTGKGKREPRLIDLDILLFGRETIESDHLTVPHRELLNRPFVLVPLLQIDPDLTHPVYNKPIAEYLSVDSRKQVLLFRDHVSRIV